MSCTLSGAATVPAFSDFIMSAAAPFSGAMASIGLSQARYSNNFPVNIPSACRPFPVISSSKACEFSISSKHSV